VVLEAAKAVNLERHRFIGGVAGDLVPHPVRPFADLCA
jgi:hypothetical protein